MTQEYFEGDGPVRMAPPSFLARTFEENIFSRGQYKILKNIVAPVPAVATMDASDLLSTSRGQAGRSEVFFNINTSFDGVPAEYLTRSGDDDDRSMGLREIHMSRSIDLQWSPIETACSELSPRDGGQSLILRGSMRSLASTKDLHGHPYIENNPGDAKLDISQIKRLLTERFGTFFNEDIVVYVPEKARTGQAAKEYFWRDGEVESRIKEQSEKHARPTEKQTPPTPGIITKVSAVQMFAYLHLYIHTRQIG
ncbi:hypothetical protein C8R44DRAFT_748461 [Mycena epipterygia]|nr:hypothetical protein C8R44DRAFT_748461 [Mycena epipterygia]